MRNITYDSKKDRLCIDGVVHVGRNGLYTVLTGAFKAQTPTLDWLGEKFQIDHFSQRCFDFDTTVQVFFEVMFGWLGLVALGHDVSTEPFVDILAQKYRWSD